MTNTDRHSPSDDVPPARAEPLVRYRDLTPAIDCPYGEVQRVVTGGAGGLANVHIVRVTAGLPHVHRGYDEVYYLLAGTGTIVLDGRIHELRPGAVVTIPRNVVHSLHAAAGQVLEFIIFGAPPMPADDPRCRPEKP